MTSDRAYLHQAPLRTPFKGRFTNLLIKGRFTNLLID